MKRLAIITCCALLVAISGFVATAYLVGSALVAPAESGPETAPVDLPVEDISFQSSSGSVLSGWFIDSDPRCGTVVLMHSLRAGKQAMVPRARFLIEAGYAVFLFDFQAHGQSPGEYITFGYHERKDAVSAVRFVSRRRSERPIAVIGISMGGAAAVLNGEALGADAVIVEAVYATLGEAVINRVRLRTGDLGLFDDFLAYALLAQLKLRLGIDAEQLRPIDRISALAAPLLIVAGSEDQHTTPSNAQQLFIRAKPPKSFWLVEGAGHHDFYRHDPSSYRTTVLEFLSQHMPCR